MGSKQYILNKFKPNVGTNKNTYEYHKIGFKNKAEIWSHINFTSLVV